MPTLEMPDKVEMLAGERADLYGALQRLNARLPLKARQQALPKPIADVHRRILRSFAERGTPLTRHEIAAILGSQQSALNAMAVLAANDLIVLDTKARQDEKTRAYVLENPDAKIIGAYPFTVKERPHRVRVGGPGGVAVHAMCAVDALAISQMFGVETCIDSKCHVTGEPIYVCQNGKQVLNVKPSPDVRVGIRWQGIAGTASESLCTEMVFLKDTPTAKAWQAKDPNAIELFTLPEAIEYAAAFFLPLLHD